jgi:hypothetical protein
MTDLAAAYLQAIEQKDPELLQKLMLSAEDMSAIQRGAGKQYWQAYFMIAKRAFMDKNKPFLGEKLEMTRFEPGKPLGQKGGIKIYRGAIVYFKTPDGKEHPSEINFIIEAQGTYKIFGLRYLSEELQRRGMLKNFGVLDEGEAKFKGVGEAPDVGIKVKKVPKPTEPTPAQE